MKTINEKYKLLCSKSSDINEHLPTLYKYATESNSILETGVRNCVSSWALLKGLIENQNKSDEKILFLNDITKCDIGARGLVK